MEHIFLRVRLILISFSVVTDLLFYFSLLHLISSGFSFSPFYFNLVFWMIPLVFIFFFLSFKFDSSRRQSRILANIYRISGFFMTIYLPKIIFLTFHLANMIFNLITRGFILILNLILSDPVSYRPFGFFTYTGLGLAIILFILLVYGALLGRFFFKTEKITLGFSNLPVSFNNFRIVQISDIHLGSWYRKEKKMAAAVSLVNGLAPDLILFTGDLVNNFSEETNGWNNILKKTSARYGKFSILGNHDYGDYWDWKNEAEKQENIQLLYRAHENMGFRLLLNQAETIGINGHEIGIIGVENWGKPPFEQYGDLRKAIADLKPVPFKILLSHDPSHWQAEVHEKTDISLTLSGHTHAMQFGFKIGRYQWSPVKYIYKLWSGLYGNNGQYLYVNRGLGSLGFPGRIGMRPEITCITLISSDK
ncbi:MAG TPA: metallophosphoesterase [Bacteroidales bacterium]|nr:metallophosphoesterase [Bacteroidales bacterium]